MALQMYVSLQGDNRIVRFLMDPATGSLEPNGDVEIGGGPAPLTFNPDNTVMYVGRRDGLLLSSFAIDQKTGDLSHTGSVELGGDTCFRPTTRPGTARSIPSMPAARWAGLPLSGWRRVPGPIVS